MIVVDASMAASLVLPDEPDPPLAVKRRLYAGPLIAPRHRPAEIGNALLIAMRRGRLTGDIREQALAQVRALHVVIASAACDEIWGDALRLADQYGLTLYDAAYLQLAVERGCVLASNDGDLIDAARACGTDILTTRS